MTVRISSGSQQPRPVASAAFPENRACQEVDAIVAPFPPVVAELLALHSHATALLALSETERCPQEYQLLARYIIQKLLKGWVTQDRLGTIDDIIPQ
ncbi:hypothetical protein AB0D13_27055 [Streptomyces sp. NPDC048430]|uniref:hypothetical protein n=1 Tax=Streptomyces sp. NPDC048430 TaxID=3155388 RepID=UPI00343CE95F